MFLFLKFLIWRYLLRRRNNLPEIAISGIENMFLLLLFFQGGGSVDLLFLLPLTIILLGLAGYQMIDNHLISSKPE